MKAALVFKVASMKEASCFLADVLELKIGTVHYRYPNQVTSILIAGESNVVWITLEEEVLVERRNNSSLAFLQITATDKEQYERVVGRLIELDDSINTITNSIVGNVVNVINTPIPVRLVYQFN